MRHAQGMRLCMPHLHGLFYQCAKFHRSTIILTPPYRLCSIEIWPKSHFYALFCMPTPRFALVRIPAPIDERQACPLSTPPNHKILMYIWRCFPGLRVFHNCVTNAPYALSRSGLGARVMHTHAVACPVMLPTKAYQNHALDLSIKAHRAS